MSGSGQPDLATADIDPGLRVAIVAARWHAEIQDALVANALATCERYEAEVLLQWVPGTFEIPVVAARLASTHDAVVAFGTVVRGGTPHFDYVCDAVTAGLVRVSLDSGVPVGFGILTCDDYAQAYDRAGLPNSAENKGVEATTAALETATILRRR